jgi:hypothetical protein
LNLVLELEDSETLTAPLILTKRWRRVPNVKILRYVSFLSFDPAAGGAMDDLIGHSITYRVALGPRAGQKVFTLHTVAVQAGSGAEKRRGTVCRLFIARRCRHRARAAREARAARAHSSPRARPGPVRG